MERLQLWLDYGNAIVWINDDSAQKVMTTVLEEYEHMGYTKGSVNTILSLSYLHIKNGNYNDALIISEKGLQYILKSEKIDSGLLEKIYNNIAATYTYLGEYKDGADYYNKALEILENTGSKRSLARAYNNLAAILLELGENEKALYYTQLGKKNASTLKDSCFVLPQLYMNECRVLMQLNRYDESLKKGIYALRVSNLCNSIESKYQATIFLGELYEKKDMMNKAIEYYKQAMEIPDVYPAGRMRASLMLGGAYRHLKNFALAQKYLDTSLAIGERVNAKRELANIYNQLGYLYQATGQYEEAFNYITKANALSDSLRKIESVKSVNLYEVKYRTAQKDKELVENKFFIAQQKEKIIRKNILIWGIAIGSLLIVGFFLLFYFYKRRLQAERERINIWRATAEGEEKERSRLARDLHDGIGGLLSTLKMYFTIIEKRQPDITSIDVYNDAKSLLDETVSEVRKTAHNLMPELLLKHGLPEAIRIFCINIQNSKGLAINFQHYGLQEPLNSNFELAIYRIIQELMQNVVKHARASFAIVQVSFHNYVLDITVEDNGIGMENTQQNTTGLGLKSIQGRVNELNGNMHITSSPGKGTTIYIEFNLQTQKAAAV